MKKNTLIIIAFAVIVLVLAVVSFMPKNSVPPVTNMPDGKMVTGSEKNTFSGTITAVDTGCFVDAICSVTVDDKKVILVAGGRVGGEVLMGKLVGVDSIGDLEGKIGAHANVYASFLTEGVYSLYGNSDYYVEVLSI